MTQLDVTQAMERIAEALIEDKKIRTEDFLAAVDEVLKRKSAESSRARREAAPPVNEMETVWLTGKELKAYKSELEARIVAGILPHQVDDPDYFEKLTGKDEELAGDNGAVFSNDRVLVWRHKKTGNIQAAAIVAFRADGRGSVKAYVPYFVGEGMTTEHAQAFKGGIGVLAQNFAVMHQRGPGSAGPVEFIGEVQNPRTEEAAALVLGCLLGGPSGRSQAFRDAFYNPLGTLRVRIIDTKTGKERPFVYRMYDYAKDGWSPVVHRDLDLAVTVEKGSPNKMDAGQLADRLEALVTSYAEDGTSKGWKDYAPAEMYQLIGDLRRDPDRFTIELVREDAQAVARAQNELLKPLQEAAQGALARGEKYFAPARETVASLARRYGINFPTPKAA